MSGLHGIWQKFVAAAYAQEEPIPGKPIIEIVGNRRILIECHRGISQYTANTVCVNVKSGYVHIAGESLEIYRMTKDRLIVCGSIHQISLSGEMER